MSDDGILILAIAALVILTGFVAAMILSEYPGSAEIQEAMRAGRVIVGMKKQQVLSVWGEPDSAQSVVSKQPASLAEGVFHGLLLSPIEQMTSFYTYTVWTYRSPWRTVRFNQAGRVVEVGV